MKLRICSKCREEKSLSSFGLNAGKLRSVCKRCEYLSDKHRPSFRACKKRSKKQQRDKRKIHEKVRVAIKRGKVVRGNCLLCGLYPGEAHHNDYDKPFEITWLCTKHHQWMHRILNKFTKEGLWRRYAQERVAE